MDAAHLGIQLTGREAWTFAQLLAWHLFERGTRPDGTRERPGKIWTRKEFDATVPGDGEGAREGRRVGQWLQSGKLPASSAGIEEALFGENPEYDSWRLELRTAYSRARASSRGEPSRPSPATEGMPVSDQHGQHIGEKSVIEPSRGMLPQALRLPDIEQNDGGDPGLHRPVAIARIQKILPSSYERLAGRELELDELDRSLSDHSPLAGIAVTAIGGMGKTALLREFCLSREIWKSYDVTLGMQFRKRQIRFAPRNPLRRTVQFDDQGRDLNLRELMIELAEQLGLLHASTKTDKDLETEIVSALANRKALIILDNLDTAADTAGILELVNRICTEPQHKILLTTRYFPDDYSSTVYPLRLNGIHDPSECKQLVLDLVRRSGTQGRLPEYAIGAVLDLAQGHPLCLELLAGKLATQGASAITDLRDSWTGSVDLSNDLFVSALCNYIFDARFLELIGELGVLLLRAIATNESGQDEKVLRETITLSEDATEDALLKLFQMNCIYREFDGDLVTLTMHPLTRAYFRSYFRSELQ